MTRADKVANETLLTRIALVEGEYRGYKQSSQHALKEAIRENKALQARVAELERAPVFPDLAGLDEQFEIPGTYWDRSRRSEQVAWKLRLTCREIFGYIAPYLAAHPNEDSVRHSFLETLMRKAGLDGKVSFGDTKIDEQAFKTIGIQLKALGLVDINYTETTTGGMALFWTLTQPGRNLMMELRTVRTAAEKK